jgi:ketosteroid isomerase-like protein
MTEHANAAVIRSAYEAIGKADMAAVAALLADDITWYESTARMEGVYRGRDQVVAFPGQVFQRAALLTATLELAQPGRDQRPHRALSRMPHRMRGRCVLGARLRWCI